MQPLEGLSFSDGGEKWSHLMKEGSPGLGMMASGTYLQEIPGGSSLVGFGIASDGHRQLAVRHRGNKVGLWSVIPLAQPLIGLVNFGGS